MEKREADCRGSLRKKDLHKEAIKICNLSTVCM